MRYLPILLLLFLFSCNSEEIADQPRAVRSNATPVRTVKPQAAGAAAATSISGVVISNSQARPSAKAGGVLVSVNFEEGQDVRRGQVLARIDATELQAGVAQAEAGLEKARRDLARLEALLADSVATRTQRNDAATAVRLAEEQLTGLRYNRAQTTITAPISGRIVRKLANTGEALGPGMPVAVIQGTAAGDWRIRAGLTDQQWAATQVGQPVRVTLDAFNGQSYTGTITERAAAIDQGSGTFPIEVRLDENPPSLAAGLLANIALPPANNAPATSPLLLPLASLGTVRGKEAEVFVVQGSTARTQVVKLGGIRAGQVEIVSGLDPGAEVITTGVAWLLDGDGVRVVD